MKVDLRELKRMAEVIEFPKKKIETDFQFKRICCSLYCQKEASIFIECFDENNNIIYKNYCSDHNI